MPEYLIQRLNEMWTVKGSAQSAEFTFTVVDPDSYQRHLITFGIEAIE